MTPQELNAKLYWALMLATAELQFVSEGSINKVHVEKTLEHIKKVLIIAVHEGAPDDVRGL